MRELNEAVVRRYFDCINARDWPGVANVTIPELSTVVRDHLARAHPDLRIDVEWIEAHGDKVSVWCFGQGTHTGPWALPPSAGAFAGQLVEPTGKSWRAACSATYRVEDGRICDVWAVWDWLSVLSQLDLLTVA